MSSFAGTVDENSRGNEAAGLTPITMKTLSTVELAALEGGNTPTASWEQNPPGDWAFQLLLDQLARQQQEEFNRWLLSLAE